MALEETMLKVVSWSHIYSHLMALEETMLKVVTFDDFFKTSRFKSCDSWQILQKPITLKIVTLGNLFFKTSHW